MSSVQAKILLLSVFVARGASFLFSKYLLEGMTPETVLAVRFTLSFLVLAVIFFRKLLACDKETFRGGLWLGILYSVCMFFEMHGLKTVDTGVSALIENMAIVLVPLYVAALTRTLPKRKTMLCCLLAIVGVALLSLGQVSGGAGRGITLIILAALTYGVCILVTKQVSSKGDPLAMGIIQLGVMGLINLVLAGTSETLRLPAGSREWGMILMLALVCSCFGFAFQPVAQKYLPAETAAVFTVVNPFTASVLGFLVAGEQMSLSKGLGYVLILGALIWYNNA